MSSVDVVIPCYNYAHYLDECVGSVLGQRGVSLRILIVDDQSPDDTPEVAARLCAADPRVGYVRNKRNLGLIGTANRGVMDWASAEYTLLLSADDLLAPNALVRATTVMDRHENIHLAYGRAIIIADNQPTPEIPVTEALTYQLISSHDFLRRSCVHGTPAPSPTAIVRTSAQHKVGGYCAEMRHTSDMDMWMRLALEGDVAAIREVQAGYRWHSANMTRQYVRGPLRDLIERGKASEHFQKEHAADGAPEFGEWMNEFWRSAGEEAFWHANRAFDGGDVEGFRECLAFALEHRPDMRFSAIAGRLWAKGLLGPANAARLRTLLRKLRGKTAADGETDWFAVTREWGWWPEIASPLTLRCTPDQSTSARVQ